MWLFRLFPKNSTTCCHWYSERTKDAAHTARSRLAFVSAYSCFLSFIISPLPREVTDHVVISEHLKGRTPPHQRTTNTKVRCFRIIPIPRTELYPTGLKAPPFEYRSRWPDVEIQTAKLGFSR